MALFDWTFCRLDSSDPSSYRQSSRFYSFCAFPRGGWCEGVLLYGSRKWVGSSVLRALSASNACFALDGPSSQRVGGFGLAESRQSYGPRRIALFNFFPAPMRTFLRVGVCDLKFESTSKRANLLAVIHEVMDYYFECYLPIYRQ